MAVVNTAAMPRGSTVAVVGLGGVGLAALLAARMLEAPHIVAIDMNDAKLAVAREFGATATVTSTPATPMILHNVPPEDLLANTRGVCDGAFDIVVRNVGTAMSTAASAKSFQRTRPSNFWKYQASISGIAIFMISEGWISMPT